MFWNKKKSSKDSSGTVRKLIIITGCAGAGKTTVGKALAKELGYSYVDKDTVSREFVDRILELKGSSRFDRESEIYVKEVMPLEYDTTFKVCRELLETGSDVVVTIPFQYYIKDFDRWLDFKNKARIPQSAEVKFVWIKHEELTERSNLTSRNADRDRNKLADWDNYADSLKGIHPDSRYEAYHYFNDCNIPLGDAIKDLIVWLNE